MLGSDKGEFLTLVESFLFAIQHPFFWHYINALFTTDILYLIEVVWWGPSSDKCSYVIPWPMRSNPTTVRHKDGTRLELLRATKWSMRMS